MFVGEPSVEDTISILRGIKDKYEQHHQVRITDAALVAAAQLSNRYITDRFLPDKAIDLMDEATSRLAMELESVPEEIDKVQRRLTQLELAARQRGREALRRERDHRVHLRDRDVRSARRGERKRHGAVGRFDFEPSHLASRRNFSHPRADVRGERRNRSEDSACEDGRKNVATHAQPGHDRCRRRCELFRGTRKNMRGHGVASNLGLLNHTREPGNERPL